MPTFTGGCLCGNVRFALSAKPRNAHSCSCKMCQRHTGALTSLWVEVGKDGISWTGPAGEPARFRSSPISSRAFCAACGSSIGAIDDKPTVGLLVGCFDKTGSKLFKPDYHSYRSGRPAWWHVAVE